MPAAHCSEWKTMYSINVSSPYMKLAVIWNFSIRNHFSRSYLDWYGRMKPTNSYAVDCRSGGVYNTLVAAIVPYIRRCTVSFGSYVQMKRIRKSDAVIFLSQNRRIREKFKNTLGRLTTILTITWSLRECSTVKLVEISTACTGSVNHGEILLI